jgi:heme O synthase-like polyprenyltransferase
MKPLALLVLLGAFVLAPVARADGDPASDYLLVSKTFLPFDVKFPANAQARFVALVDAANRGGFKIRVALIGSSYDMGSVTSLWQKPHTYARFLGEELVFLYRQRLLIVMPNGFGFNWPKHSSSAEYAILAKIPIRPGAAGMLEAAQTAVQRLASAAGVRLAAPTHVTTPAQRNAHDRLVIILASLAALAVAVLLRFALRRRR